MQDLSIWLSWRLPGDDVTSLINSDGSKCYGRGHWEERRRKRRRGGEEGEEEEEEEEEEEDQGGGGAGAGEREINIRISIQQILQFMEQKNQ